MAKTTHMTVKVPGTDLAGSLEVSLSVESHKGIRRAYSEMSAWLNIIVQTEHKILNELENKAINQCIDTGTTDERYTELLVERLESLLKE